MAKLTTFERLYRAATKYLPPRYAARIDHMRPAYRASWGGPLNGQVQRQALVRQIFRVIDFDEVIETGTFRGTTTEFFGYLSGLPVHSMETVERFHAYAVQRCETLPNVEIAHEDSRTALRRLAARPDNRRTFFYLDAHWQEDVPRHEELRIIHARWSEAVVMIDDFEVPGDEGYGVALYGGHRLTAEYLPALPGWRRFYPSTHSDAETGARRGCIVLATEALARRLDAVPLLVPVDRPAVAAA
ncbi:hypothetical protein [Aureimonas jatrophae]|nr:hypothetical protein [Aureimonas jatrophae]MBB3950223.1 hypothetical protein [Aureimonas jatrophae]